MMLHRRLRHLRIDTSAMSPAVVTLQPRSLGPAPEVRPPDQVAESMYTSDIQPGYRW